MKDLQFVVTDGEPLPNDFKALSAGLLSHHESQGHPRKSQKYCIFLKEEKKTFAWIIVTFLWNGMHIDSLWVDDLLRDQDYGSRLMKMVEDEALKRGCTIAYTDTFTWQAPAFYEKLGYTLYGRLDGFPEGNFLNYYSKKLK